MKADIRVFLGIFASVLFIYSCGDKRVDTPGRQYSGLLFGKPYTIDVVGDSSSYQHGIDSIISAFEGAYDMTRPSSIISRFNEWKKTDSLMIFVDSTKAFGLVFDLMRDLNKNTFGYYDPTTGPLKRTWAYVNANRLGEPNMDSLFEFVGFDGAKMDLIERTEGDYLYHHSELRKSDPRIEADFTKIASAMALDHIVEYLKSQKGITQVRAIYEHSMISHGVTVPELNLLPLGLSDSADTYVRITNRAICYRLAPDKMRMVDPTYGYPVENEMVYVAISAPTLAESEAFSEAFMIMGVDRIQEYYLANENSDVQSYVFYQIQDTLRNASTNGFANFLVFDSTLVAPN